MKAKTIAIMALLGEISAIDINDENMVLMRKEFENDDGDQFMAESIKEAEAELKAQQKAKAEGKIFEPLNLSDQVKAEEDRQKQEDEEQNKNVDPAKRKVLNKMTQNLIDEALNSKASIKFNDDGNIDIAVVDGNAETALIRD